MAAEEELSHFDPATFRLSACNVVDPVDRQNNVGRAVPRRRLQRLVAALSIGKRTMRSMLHSLTSVEASCDLSRMFPWTLSKFGRSDDGTSWRPDLLAHPRQALRYLESNSIARKHTIVRQSARCITSSSGAGADSLYRTMRRRRGGGGW